MMKACIIVLLSFQALVQPADSAAANPIRKVITLMQEMQKEIEVEKGKEKALFEKFMCICTEYPPELRQSIDEGGKKVDLLTSKIEEETANKGKLEQELKKHKEDKASAEKDLNQATMLREKEIAEYDSTTANTKASVEGLGKAIESLAKGSSAAALMQSGGVPQLEAMVETSEFVSSWDRQRVVAFLTGSSSDSSSGPGSSEVVGILKQMKDDMEKTLVDAEQAEKVATDAYADLKEAKDKEISVAAETIEVKEKKTGALEVSIAQSSDALDDTKAEITDSQAMLTTLETTCDDRKKEWEARLKIRDDEISAISEAISILNDDDALDVFKKAVPAGDDAGGFLQTKNGRSAAATKLNEAVTIVSKAMSKSHDVAPLGLLLYKLKSGLRFLQSSKSGNFPDMSGVAKMTETMIGVLKSEMASDEKKKTWCEDELKEAEAEEAKKQEKLDTEKATIAEISDEIAGIDDDIATLETGITEIDKQVATATETRKKEHQEYTENLQMTEVAIALLGKAKNRLQKFYNPTLYKAPPKKEKTMEEKIVGSYGFIQRHVAAKKKAPVDMPDLPELPKYEKKESGGIIALMDKIAKELEMDRVEAGHEEKTAQQEYVAFMAESQTNRAQDAKSVVQKKGSKAELEKSLVKVKQTSVMTYDEVKKAHEFIMELHSACDMLMETYKDKTAARAEEIESLENAKSVLEGAANLMSR